MTFDPPDDGSRRSSVTEKDIMDTLTDHAQRIADSVLSQPNAGEDLENDVKVMATWPGISCYTSWIFINCERIETRTENRFGLKSLK